MADEVRLAPELMPVRSDEMGGPASNDLQEPAGEDLDRGSLVLREQKA